MNEVMLWYYILEHKVYQKRKKERDGLGDIWHETAKHFCTRSILFLSQSYKSRIDAFPFPQVKVAIITDKFIHPMKWKALVNSSIEWLRRSRFYPRSEMTSYFTSFPSRDPNSIFQHTCSLSPRKKRPLSIHSRFLVALFCNVILIYDRWSARLEHSFSFSGFSTHFSKVQQWNQQDWNNFSIILCWCVVLIHRVHQMWRS